MIRLVVGPPGAGKTTYINEHRRPGDLVIDLDYIPGSFTQKKRRRAELEMKASTAGADVWIARTLADSGAREEFVSRVGVDETVILDTPAAIAKSRVYERDGNENLFPAIDRWWEQYKPEKGTHEKESTVADENQETPDVEENTEKVEETGQEENGKPDAGKPIAEMDDAEAKAYWKAFSRFHEKEKKEALAKIQQLEPDAKAWREHQSQQDDPVAAVRAEAQKEIFEARLEASAARAGVDVQGIMGHLNPVTFLDSDGHVDAGKINDFISGLPNGAPPKPQALPDDAGSNDPLPKASGLDVGRAMFEAAHKNK